MESVRDLLRRSFENFYTFEEARWRLKKCNFFKEVILFVSFVILQVYPTTPIVFFQKDL